LGLPMVLVFKNKTLEIRILSSQLGLSLTVELVRKF
jgi:hypothetical protein